MTFTGTCESVVYTWDFGDGSQATGRTVTHVFPAGYWHPTLTSDGGTEPAHPVTSISLALNGPPKAKDGSTVSPRNSR